MSKDMLGSVVRAAVGVPQARLDVLAKIASMFSNEGEESHDFFQYLKQMQEEGLPPLDTIICIDRSVPIDYSIGRPMRRMKPVFPELEATAPASYDLAHVKQWVHEGQGKHAGDSIACNDLLKYVLEHDMARNALGLADLVAIARSTKRQGRRVWRLCGFEWHCCPIGWRSLCQDENGRHWVPYMRYIQEGKIEWKPLDTYVIGESEPMLLFP